MISRDEALEKAAAMSPKTRSLGAHIKRLILAGFLDTPATSRQIVDAVRSQFGRRFRVTYVQTYMRPYLEAGVVISRPSPDGKGNIWFGTWIPDDERSLRVTAERLRIKADTTRWQPEVAEDFQLALACYSAKLWKPAAVMTRRAYEGALSHRYRTVHGTEPEKEGSCPKCNTKLGRRPMSITDLHNWAVRSSLVREKMDGVSVLLKDLGAGGAHPTKNLVIDPDTAEIIVKCGSVLLHDLHRGKKFAPPQALNAASSAQAIV
jgi:hypothetical protein